MKFGSRESQPPGAKPGAAARGSVRVFGKSRVYCGTFCNPFPYGKLNNLEISSLLCFGTKAVLSVVFMLSYKKSRQQADRLRSGSPFAKRMGAKEKGSKPWSGKLPAGEAVLYAEPTFAMLPRRSKNPLFRRRLRRNSNPDRDIATRYH